MKKYLFILFLISNSLHAEWIRASGQGGSGVSAFVVSGANLFAGTNGGIILSTDNGTSWSEVNTGLTNTYVTSLAVSPNGGGGTTLFAGTLGGVFLSTNNGTSWKATSLTNTYVYSFALSDTNLFAGTNGGVFLSSNNGTSWTVVNTGLTDVLSLAVSGTNLFAGTASGVFLSTNNGTSWTAVNTGLTYTSVSSLAVTPNGAGGTNLFAVSYSSWGGHFFSSVDLSTNNGTSWTAANTSFSSFSEIVEIGANLFAGTSDGVFLSTSYGANWTADNTGLPSNTSVWSLAVSPNGADGTNLFAGTDGGVFLSTNDGTSWTAVNLGLADIYIRAFAISGTNLFAGGDHHVDEETIGNFGAGVFISTNNGTSWTATSLTNAYVYALAVSPNGAGGTNLFAGTNFGVFLSTNSGTSWSAVNTGLTNTSIYSLAISTNGAGDTNLFAGTWYHGVFLTTNNGTSWSAASTGLPSNTFVWSLAVSPNGSGGTNLFAGTGGGVFLSTNNGTSWTAVNTGLTSTSVRSLAVSPNGAGGTNLLAGTGIPYSGGGRGVFLSTNNGTSWTAVNTGLTSTSVLALAVSPNGSGGTNLFAGTSKDWNGSAYIDGSVFLSTNNGTSWTEVNTGLTSTGINSFAVLGTNLFAGTSSGVWRRPLSEMITSVERLSTNLPTHFSLDQNYPNPFNPSTTIRYSLPSSAHVKLTIHDILGREIATLVNEEQSAGWKEVEWNARNFASGIYLVRMSAGNFIETKKILLMK